MQAFDQAILDLYHQGKITRDEALANADSRHNLEVAIRLEQGKMGSASSGLRIDDGD